jgi:hypothetical protein
METHREGPRSKHCQPRKGWGLSLEAHFIFSLVLHLESPNHARGNKMKYLDPIFSGMTRTEHLAEHIFFSNALAAPPPPPHKKSKFSWDSDNISYFKTIQISLAIFG